LTIFVSIASYRDPELVPTIQDCLAKAQNPDELYFGVSWQHGSEEDIHSICADPRIRIFEVDWRNSRGVCWARAGIMGIYRGEDYFLQIDSHHRFVQNWDVKLIEYIGRTASPKPIITTYCPMYSPGQLTPQSSEPTQMGFHYFTADGIPMFRPTAIPDWKTLKRPVRGRFISAHFLFTLGSFVEEVPYDPDLYFHGEEITLAIRAYSWGYDFFHPPEVLLWHAYSRAHRSSHWDDHVESAGVEVAWQQRDQASKARVLRLLLDPFVGRLGCGPIRTVAEYEAYAGISFRYKKVQDYTLRGAEPPNPVAEANWHESVRRRRGQFDILLSQFPLTALMDAQFWYVGIQDSTGAELHRIDLPREVLDRAMDNGCELITLQYEFDCARAPARWTVCPFSYRGGWLAKISGPC
jgi:Glycosyltransferase (GlcNAc)